MAGWRAPRSSLSSDAERGENELLLERPESLDGRTTRVHDGNGVARYGRGVRAWPGRIVQVQRVRA